MPERSGTSGVFGAFQGITLPIPTPVLISHGWHAPRVPVAFCRSAGVGGQNSAVAQQANPPRKFVSAFWRYAQAWYALFLQIRHMRLVCPMRSSCLGVLDAPGRKMYDGSLMGPMEHIEWRRL